MGRGGVGYHGGEAALGGELFWCDAETGSVQLFASYLSVLRADPRIRRPALSGSSKTTGWASSNHLPGPFSLEQLRKEIGCRMLKMMLTLYAAR